MKSVGIQTGSVTTTPRKALISSRLASRPLFGTGTCDVAEDGYMNELIALKLLQMNVRFFKIVRN